MGIIQSIISSAERASKVKNVTKAVVGTSSLLGAAVSEVAKYKSTPKLRAPRAAEEYVGLNYIKVKEELSAYGFRDIRLIPRRDIILGIFAKPGTVKSIAINGEDSFRKKSVHLATSVVTIEYHEK